MNQPDPIALTRTHDEGLNTVRQIMPEADASIVAANATLMNRGLLTAEQIRAMFMRARALPC